MSPFGVVVVGSGLAGMAAAYRLAAAGRRVLVLEAGPVVGGRTASWSEDGMPVESGLHKFLGIYRALPRLLRDTGTDPDAILAWVDEVEVHVPGSERPERIGRVADAPAVEGRDVHARFGAAPYHKPLRTLLGLLGNNRLIPPLAKFRLARMAARGLYDCARRPLELDRRNIADYARSFGLSDRVVHDFLYAVTTGVLFMPPEEFSAYRCSKGSRAG